MAAAPGERSEEKREKERGRGGEGGRWVPPLCVADPYIQVLFIFLWICLFGLFVWFVTSNESSKVPTFHEEAPKAGSEE